MKKYLIGIVNDEQYITIGTNPDNLKQYVIRVNGSQVGKNYSKLGNAANELYRIYQAQRKNGIINQMLIWGDRI
jgi:hypothetical protein